MFNFGWSRVSYDGVAWKFIFRDGSWVEIFDDEGED